VRVVVGNTTGKPAKGTMSVGCESYNIAKPAAFRNQSFSLFDFPNAHIESMPPSTLFDFSKSIEGVPVPVIGHETGQFQVYPDFRDIPKFTGVLRARNYEIFRERLEKAGMLDQAQDFVRASGALAAICYREDIEAALRTPELGGFQFLDIMDFPGQGTALVGMLNVFMESKGVIDPKDWREFCSETVPLIRMGKYTWTSDETFSGRVQVAHYGAAGMNDAVVSATLSNGDGGEVARFSFPPTTLRQGGVTDVGEYRLPLNSTGIVAPQKLTLTLAVEGTSHRNRYPVWVYPPKADTAVPAGVMVTDSFAATKKREHLASGGKVLLFPKHDKLPHSVPASFFTVCFVTWNRRISRHASSWRQVCWKKASARVSGFSHGDSRNRCKFHP
jgi:hypothetical protein